MFGKCPDIPEIKVTPEMIEAGLAVIEREFGPYGIVPDIGERVVCDVFYQMRQAQKSDTSA